MEGMDGGSRRWMKEWTNGRCKRMKNGDRNGGSQDKGKATYRPRSLPRARHRLPSSHLLLPALILPPAVRLLPPAVRPAPCPYAPYVVALYTDAHGSYTPNSPRSYAPGNARPGVGVVGLKWLALSRGAFCAYFVLSP